MANPWDIPDKAVRSVLVRVDDAISLHVKQNTCVVRLNGEGIGCISRAVASAIFWDVPDLADAFRMIPPYVPRQGAGKRLPYSRDDP